MGPVALHGKASLDLCYETRLNGRSIPRHAQLSGLCANRGVLLPPSRGATHTLVNRRFDGTAASLPSRFVMLSTSKVCTGSSPWGVL